MSNQPSEALKPCPFCRGEAEMINGSSIRFTEWLIICKGDCLVSPDVRKETPEAAIAAWNTRTGEDERIAQAVGIEKREARLNLENRMKEQLLEAVQAEREQIIKRLNRQIIGYIQDKSLDFETTATLKEATDIAIKIVKGE